MTIKGIDIDKLLAALDYCDTGSCSDCVYYEICTKDECQSAMHQDAKQAIYWLVKMAEQASPLRNCVNCNHAKVCATVEKRKLAKLNNYTPCEHWEPIKG